jgi:hypothetical protein
MLLQETLLFVFLASFGADPAIPAQSTSACEVIWLNFRDQAVASNAVVCLADLVQGEGISAERMRDFAAVELFPAPQTREGRWISRQEVVEILLRRGWNPHSLVATGARWIHVLPPTHAPRVSGAPGNQAALAPPTPSPRPARLVPGPFDAARSMTIDPGNGPSDSRDLSPGRTSTPAGSGRVPRMVNRGDLVTVWVRGAAVQIKAIAKARQSGDLGDEILIESPSNRNVFPARVCDYRTVEVILKTNTAAAQPQDLPPTGEHPPGAAIKGGANFEGHHLTANP